MKDRQRSKKLFRKWLIVEALFLLFMILVSIGIYFYTNYHIRSQLDELYIGKLNTVYAQVDATFDAVSNTVDEYAMRPDIRALSALDEGNRGNRLVHLVDEIKQTNASISGISEIVICFTDNNLFVSSAGIMSADVFDETYDNYSTDGVLLSNVITNANAAGRLSIVGDATALQVKSIDDRSYVCAIIDKWYIESLLQQSTYHKEDIYAVLVDSIPVFVSNSSFVMDEISFENTGSDAIKQIMVDEEEYYLISRSDVNVGYISLIDHDNYFEQHFSIQRTAIIVLVITSLLGAILSYVITKYKYLPVKEVVTASKAITPDRIYASSDDELKQIKKAIEFIHSQKESAQKILDDHTKDIVDNTIKMILDDQIAEVDISTYIRDIMPISNRNRYTIAIVEVSSKVDISVVHHSIRSMDRLDLYSLIKGGRIVLIFRENVEEQISILKDNDDIDILSLGRQYRGLKGLAKSYKQAQKGLVRKIMPNTTKVLIPIDGDTDNYLSISSQEEIELVGYIHSGNESTAIDMLDTLIRKVGHGNVDPFMYKTFLYSVANCIIYSAESVMNSADLGEIISRFNKAIERQNHSVIIDTLHKAITNICTLCTQKMQSSNDILNTRIVEYVQGNISNPQISSEMIAQSMGINSVYLRRFFREHNGIALWDYIHMRRIERARSMMVSTNKSIKNTASECGYVSISTFVRTFKKFTGMAPGHYRNLYK